ncbi:hypothetical protein [Caulobacter vibrioides]|uniref:Uncharacterized protein n=1 Tax=Caulobacter phage S2B TaxID=2759120 RepID=A0AAE7MLB5_9CAUD|nr:hypothetical protein [Caulobacter vibrioides]QOC54149.1 hypothetical protein [Caulobacter phage S2B]QXZ50177.1 hypothetical protein KZH45_09600 [Caulobacter vibrioides]
MKIAVGRSNAHHPGAPEAQRGKQGTALTWELRQDEVAEILAKGGLEDWHVDYLVSALRRHMENGRQPVRR